MTRSLLAPLIWVLLTLPVHAGSVEFAQWIPWNFISQELRRNEFSLEINRPELTLKLGELSPLFSEVSLSSRTSFGDLEQLHDGISVNGTGSMTLHLSAFSINQTILREIGGNVLEIHLKAECAPVRLSVSAFELQSHFQFPRAGEIVPRLYDLGLMISPGDWSVGPITCQGLNGIGREIELAIKNAMSDPAALSAMVTAWMRPFVDQWMKDQWLRIAGNEERWHNLAFDRPEQNGFFLRGELPLTTQEHFVLEGIPSDPGLSVPRFYISRAGWEALTLEEFRKILPPYYDLRQIKSFRKLLSSRFLQFFLWPHLRKFHAATPFVLKNAPGAVKLTLKEFQDRWLVTIAGKGSLATLVGGSPIDYIVYGYKLTTPLTMNLEHGNLVIKSEKASVLLEWNFGELYKLLYSPDKKVPVHFISGALATLASDKEVVIPLPKFHIGESGYILGNLRIEDQLLTMDWL